MMRRLILSALVGCLVLGGSLAHAQTPAIQQKVAESLAKEKDKKPPTLEDLLGQALKNNPDIRVAEAKVREAEAELNRMRLQVTQKMAIKHSEIEAGRAVVAEASAKFERANELRKRSVISLEEYRSVELTLQKVKAELARAEAELPYLLGSGHERFSVAFSPDGRLLATSQALNRDHWIYGYQLNMPGTNRTPVSADGLVRLWDTTTGKELTGLPADTADKIRKALDAPVKVDFVKLPPSHILSFARDKAKGLNVIEAFKMADDPVTLQLPEPVPLGALFQWFEDQYGCRFIVREYGVVLADPGRLPPGAIGLHDFWKKRAGEKKQ
jgi:hypothetical protein